MSRSIRNVSFGKAVRDWRLDTEAKLERCAKISAGVLADAAQANAPRRTGKLRRSLRVQVGADAAPDPNVRKALDSYRLGDRITFTWTAFYAWIQEKGGRTTRGKKIGGKRFVERASKQWPAIVARVAERISREK